MAETTIEPATPPWTGTPTPEELEQRLQRLEDVVANLCDTQGLEDRVRDRVVEQLRAEIELLKSQRPTSPAGEPGAADKPRSSAELPPVAQLVPPVPPPPESGRSLFREFWWETRTFSQMLRDPIYRLSWAARLVLLVPAAYILWSLFVNFPRGIPLIGVFLDFALVFVIAYVVLKVFGREVRRYREFTTHNPW